MRSRPAQHRAHQRAAQQEHDSRPHHPAHDEHRHRQRNLVRWEAVADDRIGPGGKPGFAATHQRARAGQRGKPRRQSADPRAHAPDDDAAEQHPAPAAAVEHQAHRHRADRVKHRKGRPLQQPDLGVGKPEVVLDRVDHQRHQIAVGEAADVEHEQHDHRQPGKPGARISPGFSHCCAHSTSPLPPRVAAARSGS